MLNKMDAFSNCSKSEAISQTRLAQELDQEDGVMDMIHECKFAGHKGGEL